MKVQRLGIELDTTIIYPRKMITCRQKGENEMEFTTGFKLGKENIKTNGRFEKFKSFLVDEVTELIKEATKERGRRRIEIWEGYTIKPSSHRYQLFMDKGCTCVTCGVQGKYYTLERNAGTDFKPHLNLYAIKEDGTEVLMTKDHIIAKSKGGPNEQRNYQPMCTECNQKKGNS